MGAYLYGDLGPSEMRELRLHTQECTACRDDLASQGQVISALSDSIPVLSDQERERIMWSVKGAIGKRETERRPLMLRFAPAISLAAVLLVGIGIGRLIDFRGSHPSPDAKQRTAHVLPQARVTIKEVTKPDTNAQKDNQQPGTDLTGVPIDLMSHIPPPPSTTRTPVDSSRHIGNERTATGTPDNEQVNTAPDAQKPNSDTKTTDAAVKEQQAKPETPAQADSGDTKLPKVNDLKNAETTSSNPQ